MLKSMFIWTVSNTFFSGPILTIQLFSFLECVLLAYWLFISTYKAYNNALFWLTIFRSLKPHT